MIKKHLLFLLLIPIVIISQIYLLAPHLQYGLADLDDGSIYGFKKYVRISPNIIGFFTDSYKELGVYSHQYYYLGILNFFFSSNIEAYHQVTHFFKIAATLSSYPFFYIVTGSSLIAFVSALFFAFSHSAAGSMQLVVTGSDYPAIFVFLIFLSLYFYLVKNGISKLSWVLITLLFFSLAMALSTERIYPVILLLPFIEIFWILRNRSKKSVFISIKRLTILYSPIIIAVMIAPVFLGLLIPNSTRLLQSLSEGRWDLALIPFIALGSTILTHDLWKYTGIVPKENLADFVNQLIYGPLLPILVVTYLVSLILSRKSLRFTFIIILVTLLGSVISHYFSLGHPGASVNVAVFGFYILGFSLASFIDWMQSGERKYLGLFLGPFIAFFFIFNTWVATMDRDLVFGGVHRYVTIPSIFISLFLGSILGLMFKKFFRLKSFRRLFFLVPFFLLIIILFTHARELTAAFSYDLKNGYGIKDKIYMRQQLLPYMNNLKISEPTLFYFDIYTDSANSFYYGNTVISGFNAWTLWLPNVDFRSELTPSYIADFNKLKASVMQKNGIRGIFYENKFFKGENFYAFLLQDKEVFDITDKIKKELGLIK